MNSKLITKTGTGPLEKKLIILVKKEGWVLMINQTTSIKNDYNPRVDYQGRKIIMNVLMQSLQ